MFSPNNTTNFSAFWSRLSTFYDFVPKNEKKLIEAYWKQLFNAMEGLSYDLAQVGLTGYLDYAPGYIEEQHNEYNIIFSGDDKNVILERLTGPVIDSASNIWPSGNNVIYNYKITTVDVNGNETLPSEALIIISGANSLGGNNNTISWFAATNATSYNVYGRTQNSYNYITNTAGLSFVDNGSISTTTSGLPIENTSIDSYLYKLPNNYPYLTIPILSGINTGNILTEGTDFEIDKLHHIKFLGDAAAYTYSKFSDQQEVFEAPQALHLLPSLTNLYFKSFGGPENPEGVVNANAYTPYINGYSSLSNFEQKKAGSIYLKHLSQALTNTLGKGPSFKNLTEGFCLISGMPFSYEAGIASIETSGADNIVTISGGNDYLIPFPLTLNVGEGEEVEKYQILASGISLHDYISSSGILTELTADNPEQFYYTLGIQRSTRTFGLNHYQPFVDYYTNYLLPAGLLVNYFNLPPRGNISSNDSFAGPGGTVELTANITDPEDDILTYDSWVHVKPLTTWDGSPSLVCTMNQQSSPNEHICDVTLTTPPVDRYYLFRVIVGDSGANIVNIDIEQNIHGTFAFTTWGQTQFQLGDAELRYTYLS